ncbi:MAG TPA: YihY/virulence factor BrkB family protein [Crocinitomicaceae bacterium]|nr:YihY/virulence factor BrkB family protein [Crocinitomicaceae bacterium]
MTWEDRKQLVKTSFLEFFQEKSMLHGAALAYYAMLALVPILYLTVTYVGRFVGEEKVIDAIGNMLRENVGLEDPSGILSFLDEVDFLSGSAMLETIGVIALMFSCTVIFNSLKGSINEFYNIEKSKINRKKKIVRTVLSRIISMGFIIGLTLFFILLYFAEPLFLSLGHKLLSSVAILESLFSTVARHGIPILTNMLIFSFIFKYLHDGSVEWRNAFRGGLVTSVLLYLGQLLIKYYLTHFFFGASGGVAGAMLIILVWVYYSSQIIFFGAKYIAVLSRMRGCEIKFLD